MGETLPDMRISFLQIRPHARYLTQSEHQCQAQILLTKRTALAPPTEQIQTRAARPERLAGCCPPRSEDLKPGSPAEFDDLAVKIDAIAGRAAFDPSIPHKSILAG